MPALTPASLADFDAALLVEYQRFRSLLPGQTPAVLQRRFAQQGVFPQLGWALIGVGERQALAEDNPDLLHATLTRFLKCAHHCWGPTDEAGLHWGGLDHCALVVPALYAAPLGGDYLAAVFHPQRPLARTGPAALVHAANLLVCIDNPAWARRAQALAAVDRYLAGKRRPPADDAFVRFLLAVLARDGSAAAQALGAFAAAYPVSDWGRHKPGTAPTFLQALLTYAEGRLPQPLGDAVRQAVMPAELLRLWAAMRQSLERLNLAPHRFDEPLGFLNDLAAR